MDYKKIIEDGELIYSSIQADAMFREWKLARTMCHVEYFVTHPLTKLDKVILLTLDNNGRIYENQLAKILGFNVENDFEVSPKRYADNGEAGIFDGLLKEVASFGLINRNDNKVSLSFIGKLALKQGVKYSFHRGTFALMESFDIGPKDSVQYKMFPFRDCLGVCTTVQSAENLKYDEFDSPDLENELYGEPTELVAQLSYQCNSGISIFRATKSTDARMGEIYVDFRLYKFEGKMYPLAFHDGEISIAANDLIYNECNKNYVTWKTHIGEYLHLVRISDASLTYASMIPYQDIWNLDDFLGNKRMAWDDAMLFDAIAKEANGSQWNVISTECPVDILVQYLPKYKDTLDWIVLSKRYDDDFIVKNATVYPWDYETLSSERSSEFVKKVIVIPELHHDIDWDWETILAKVDDEFVLSHLAEVPFVMFAVSQKYLDEYPDAIINHPNRKWDWNLISSKAGLDLILNNVNSLSSYIQLDTVMSRAFVSTEYTDKFCDSSEFTFAVLQKKEWLQKRYQANKADYPWTIKLIDWHEQLGFITWRSENYADGLECNPGISWTREMFEHYKDRIFSVKGLNHISQSITDISLIDTYPDFKWNWSLLSERETVTKDISFLERHLSQLSLDNSIPIIKPEVLSILYSLPDFKQVVTEQKVWDKLTNFIEKKTILRNTSDPNWDWHVITKNFCETLNFSVLDRLNVLNKLDWDYISQYSDISKITDCLDDYSDRWNWNILTKRLDHDFIVEHLAEFFNNWDWEYIITDVLTEGDLSDTHRRTEIAIILSQFEEENRKVLWEKLTAIYSTEDIFSINLFNAQINNDSVRYEWNYEDVYNRPDFDVNRFLDDYRENNTPVDWDILSSSKALNKILSWDKKAIKDFHMWEDFVTGILSNTENKWNFKYLSTLASINWCESILQVREEEWDWEYLSEHSKCFCYNPKRPNELVKHIRKFAYFIDFKLLSKRPDMKLTSEMLSELLNYDWDWSAISCNKGFSLSAPFVQDNINFSWDFSELSSRKDCVFSPEFILENKHLNWDWQALSKRKDISFTPDAMIKLIDKDWDWKELQRRTDIVFNEEILPQLIDKDIDWKSFSRRGDFVPTMRTLKALRDKDLDWDDISNRAELPYEVIVFYKDKLSWSILTMSNHIDLRNGKVLETFRDNLDWSAVSSATEFHPTFDNLKQFKDKVYWPAICRRSDIIIDFQFLDTFKDKVDWKRISQSGSIPFSEELIDRYKDKWDWVALAENPAFRSSGIDKKYKAELNLREFYNKLKVQNGRPFVYHFTHLFNAIEVIKTRKILSRNRASELGLLKYDAAGSVVYRSAKAHPYARFYYRTGTQTQFYNECLGKQRGDKYYCKAEDNGLPMCPMPVFFKFDLEEVLAKHSNLCYYSTGNMQTNWASVFKVIDDPNNIDSVNLYRSGYDRVVMDKKQQEFLVKNELDFSEFNDYQIICYDQEETDILRAIFKDDPVSKHIYCVYDTENVFEKENPNLRFELSEERVKITTNYYGEYIFQVESPQINKVIINNTASDIKAIKGHIIQLYNDVSVERGDAPFDIYYVNMNPNARSPRWLVYQYTPSEKDIKITESNIIEKFLGISFDDDSYSPDELITSLELAMPRLEELYNTKVRHYVIKTHTMLVCEQFEKYPFKFDGNYMNIDMMRIILAVHDVGKGIDRSAQHEHTIKLIKEFWDLAPFTKYELTMAETLLKDDHMGSYFQGKYSLEDLTNEIIKYAHALTISPEILLQYKMILYQCDIASYTKDAGGLKYLEHMFEYVDDEKVFDDTEGILKMSAEYNERYKMLKSGIHE